MPSFQGIFIHYPSNNTFKIPSNINEIQDNSKIYMISPFNHEECYLIKKNTHTKISNSDLKTNILKLLNKEKEKEKETQKYPIGFRNINKQKESKYKLRFDQNKSGTVCNQAGVTNQQLINHIKEIYPDFNNTKKHNKEHLCIISEYASRKIQAENFKRNLPFP